MSDQYSKNRLKNSDASEGLTDWSSVNVTAEDGVFILGENASLSQVISVPGQPTAYAISCEFLPLNEPIDTETRVFLEVEYSYGDETTDTIIFPVDGESDDRVEF